MDIRNDDFIRTTEARHIAREPGSVATELAKRPRRDLSRPICRLVLRCATRRSTTRANWSRPDGRRADRRRGRMGRRGELFLPPVGLAGPAAGVSTSQPDFIAPRSRRNEVDQLRQGRAQRPVDLAHQLHLGHPGAGRSQAVMYVWLDALTNYLTARRLSRHRERRVPTILAGRSAYGRQGHRALSTRLLAGLSDGRRARAAAPRLRPWLVDGRRREDVEIARQLRAAARARRPVRRRPGALFPAARAAVRQ